MSMAKTVLFVSQKKSFLISAIMSSLEKENYQTATSLYDLTSFEMGYTDSASVFLFIEDESVANNIPFLSRIKDLRDVSGIRVFLMGDQLHVDAVCNFLGESNNNTIFYRPINAKDVTSKMLEILQSNVTHVEEDKKSILVVDDSGTFLHTIKSWLSPYYKVSVVNSATMGLSYMGKNCPDLILLDYEMPICSGPQMLEMIRADVNFASVPVFFLTGKGDRASITKVLDLKPQGYLLKNLPKDKILEAINNYFENN